MNDAIMQIVCFWFLTPLYHFFQMIMVIFASTIVWRLFVFHRKRKKVAIVVLGDIGRSPRMQYHALSLARHSYGVKLVGYPGEFCGN